MNSFFTFLDGVLQSGQRSKDLDLPTSGSCSPSATKSQGTPMIQGLHLYFILSEGIAMGSHKLDDSFKVALSRTNWMAKNPCISLRKVSMNFFYSVPFIFSSSVPPRLMSICQFYNIELTFGKIWTTNITFCFIFKCLRIFYESSSDSYRI